MDRKSFNEYMMERGVQTPRTDRATRWGIPILALFLFVLIGLFFWYNNRTASFMTSGNRTSEDKPGFFSQLFGSSTETPATAADADNDGLADNEEAEAGTNPQLSDSDNDGLSDREEARVYKTDPLKADTDNDNVADAEEIKNRRDPLNPAADAVWPPRPAELSIK